MRPRLLTILVMQVALLALPALPARAVTPPDPVVASFPILDVLRITFLNLDPTSEEPRRTTMNCHTEVNYSFSGTRDESGNVEGEWHSMHHGTACSVEGTEATMDSMYISSQLRRNNAAYATIPTQSCNNCVRTFETGAAFACASCNGSYQAHATLELNPPSSAVAWRNENPNCDVDENNVLYCSLYSNIVGL